MEYSIDLLSADKLKYEKLLEALNSEPKDWETIVIAERKIADLSTSIDVLINVFNNV